MLLIQYIKNSVFSVSSVVNLLNQILSQSRTLRCWCSRYTHRDVGRGIPIGHQSACPRVKRRAGVSGLPPDGRLIA
jgi:hypothetical protein